MALREVALETLGIASRGTYILTSPAPNAGEADLSGEDRPRELGRVLRQRARQVLPVAADRGHRCLVLGAWGCGVFRCDPAEVAEAFATALEDPVLAAAFDRVVFAIWERSPERPFANVFAARLGVAPARTGA